MAAGRDVLATVSRLGGYFVVSSDPAQYVDPTWRPLSDLVAADGPLTARIAHVARTLSCDDRVAASIAFQGLAAQLVAVPFAGAVLTGRTPMLTADVLHWRPVASGPWPLWCPSPDLADFGALPGLLDDLVGPLAAAVRRLVPVSERVLLGNAGSGLAAAAAQIGREIPARREVVSAALGELLAHGVFAGTGQVRGGTFRRNSCCLYYRVVDGGYCGDCVLAAR